MPSDAEIALHHDLVIAYAAALSGKSVPIFLAEYAVFLRLHKRQAMTEAIFEGSTYGDLFKSLGCNKVKNYLEYLKKDALTLLDLFPLAHFLGVAIHVFTISANGAGLVLTRTINETGKLGQKVLSATVINGELSLHLENKRTAKSAARAALVAGLSVGPVGAGVAVGHGRFHAGLHAGPVAVGLTL